MTEIARRLNADEARALTDEIRGAAEQVYALLLKAHEGEAWTPLGYGSWREYAMAEFGMSQSYAYRLLDQARVIREIEAASVSPIGELPNEGQARELARVPEGERAEVWREAVERTGGRPTAAAIRETWRPPLDEPAEKPRPEPDTWYGGPPDLPEPDDGPPESAPLPDRQDEADVAVHRIERAAMTPPPAPDGPPEPSRAVVDYIAADPAWQDQAYITAFSKALARGHGLLAFDPARLGRIGPESMADELDSYLAGVEKFISVFRAGRRGLRVIEGGQ